jgi:hypothetical protein
MWIRVDMQLRKPSLQVVADWRDTGGEQSRKEYLEAFAANG